MTTRSEKDWAETIASVRKPLGVVTSLRLLGAQFTATFQGLPDAEYVGVQFKTDFADKLELIDTVTPMKDGKGIWKVSGYYIK